jgi:hypothetical protein
MVGGAAEAIILELRDLVVTLLEKEGKPVSRLTDWKIRTVTTALEEVFDVRLPKSPLRDRYETYWAAFVGQIRTARNDAGHPTSIDPVTPDTVHASLLIFPEVLGLTNALRAWVCAEL